MTELARRHFRPRDAPARPADAPEGIQNIMLVAFKSSRGADTPASADAALNALYSHRWTRDIDRAEPVLTDDHAPVDAYPLTLLKG